MMKTRKNITPSLKLLSMSKCYTACFDYILTYFLLAMIWLHILNSIIITDMCPCMTK